MIWLILYLFIGYFFLCYFLDRPLLNEELTINLDDFLYWNEIKLDQDNQYKVYLVVKYFIAILGAIFWLPLMFVFLVTFIMESVYELMERPNDDDDWWD